MLSDFQQYVDQLPGRYKVPAVSLAVWQDGKLHQAAAGILNLNTGVEATTDSIFQIGSITKVFTTCLVMQLVDEGKVDLDKPAQHYLRDFQVGDANASETITVRQLLNHTNGIAGDYFPDDLGQQGNLIARYVDRCSSLPLVHPVGELFSYSNAAFAVAGRLVEVVRGISWHRAMREYIYQPLGLNHAIAEPMDMIRYRTAIGHVLGEGEKSEHWGLPDKAYLTLGQAPAGSLPFMSAADLITFARAHLDGGFNQAGERWLSQAAIDMMQNVHKDIPPYSQIKRDCMGLGWMLSDYHANGVRVIHHGGATNGFLAMLQMIPERNTAFAVLLNGSKIAALEGITNELLAELVGIETGEPEPEGEADPAAHQKLTGHYDSLASAIDVAIQDGQLTAAITPKVGVYPPEVLKLQQVEAGSFATYQKNGERGRNIVFLQEDERGVPRYLFFGMRLHPRQDIGAY